MRINFASSQDLRFWRALDRTRAELLAGASAAPTARSGRSRPTPAGAKMAG
jgi:hypothetical protein